MVGVFWEKIGKNRLLAKAITSPRKQKRVRDQLMRTNSFCFPHFFKVLCSILFRFLKTPNSPNSQFIFRSRKKCSTTYTIVQFLCFFLPIFHENFKFLKSCPYDFHKILHSHSTPKGAPSCSKASKSYDWNVRNMAKISPKMTKKLPFFDSFRLFSQKLSIRFEQNFIQSLYTILGSYMCNGIKIVWLRCETHKPKLTQKWPKNSHFSTFFDFCKNSPYDSNESVSEGKRLKPTPLPHMRLWFCLNKTFSTHLSINMFELTVFL